MSETPQMNRGFRIAFAISLGLNVLVIGAVLGTFLQDSGAPTRLAATPNFNQSIQALPDVERQALISQLRDLAAERGTPRSQRINAMRMFTQALRQEPMDREAIVALWAQRQTTGDMMRQEAETLLLDTLEGLPLSERMAFLERLNERQSNRPRPPRGESDWPRPRSNDN